MENTTTLVDMSFTMLQDLSQVGGQDDAQQNFVGQDDAQQNFVGQDDAQQNFVGQDDAQQNFVAMLSTLRGTMTDRASVVKSFSRQFDIERKEMLQTESSVQLLHCNARVAWDQHCVRKSLEAGREGER